MSNQTQNPSQPTVDFSYDEFMDAARERGWRGGELCFESYRALKLVAEFDRLNDRIRFHMTPEMAEMGPLDLLIEFVSVTDIGEILHLQAMNEVARYDAVAERVFTETGLDISVTD